MSATHLPTKEALSEFYIKFNESYTGGGKSCGGNLYRYAKRYLHYIEKYDCSGSMIDVGSSTNPFPNLASQAGFTVTVMDYVKPKGLNPEVQFLEYNLIEDDIIKTNAGSFDVVTAWAVLEHVPHPSLSIRMLSVICKPGGMIFISTPEIGTFSTRLSIGRSGWFQPPLHLNLISPNAMKDLFAQNCCDLIRCEKLELNSLRWAARYGTGLAEALIGLPVKALMPIQWKKLRDNRVQKYKGISIFVFKRKNVNA